MMPSPTKDIDNQNNNNIPPNASNSLVAPTFTENLLHSDDDVPLSVKLAKMRAQRDEQLKAAKAKKELELKEKELLKKKRALEELEAEKMKPPVEPLKEPQSETDSEASPIVKRTKIETDKESDKPFVEISKEKLVRKEHIRETPSQPPTIIKEKEPTLKSVEIKIPKEKKESKPKEEKKPKIKKDKPEKEIKKEKAKKPVKEEDENEEGSDYAAWQASNFDGTVKWNTLEHNGLLFPPPYIPHGIPLVYDGKKLVLEPDAEEVASFFAALIETDHGKNPTFQQNFFSDFKDVLKDCKSKYKETIKEFGKCNFKLMFDYFAGLKEEKKAMTKEQKEEQKELKKQLEDKYGWAYLDGEKEKVGNFRVEPPGLFRGRGKHPKTGKLKRRVMPEQVTVNIGKEAKVPEPPFGHRWGNIVHDNTVTWLATWTENINGNIKYVFLAPGSSLKSQSDLKKFETARKLKQHVGHIRDDYMKELKDKEMMVRQRATALWLIDKLALRAGNEKGEDEADTVGCCSLRCEHVVLEEPDQVIFDFLGKDSIRYYNKVAVDPIVFKNMQLFMKPPKQPQDPIFDRLNTATLNKYLTTLMPGLTAKVFRTYNASHTFQNELDSTPFEGTVAEKILAYNRANRQVAILCNHQRAVPKTHDQSMERLREKILTLKYQRHLIRKELREQMDKKELKKTLPEALEDESDMDKETLKRKHLEEIDIEKAKFTKKNPDAAPKDFSPSKRRNTTSDTLLKKFDSLTMRIHAAKHQLTDRDENKTTALGTSKTNYIDPRITAAWCIGHEVPIERMFNESLREKFKWAMDVPKTWQF
jgi:DNA topoisomerase I